MTASHPHALLGTDRLQPGEMLPALLHAEQVRGGGTSLRTWIEVVAGVWLAIAVGYMCARGGGYVFTGTGWGTVIGWESVWLVAAILCSFVLPSGIRPDISVRSTLEGLKLDWPELVYGTWVLGAFVTYIGELRFEVGPIGMALAVGTAEEFIFRVLLLGWLVTKLPAHKALVVSSIVFGIAHLHEVSLVGALSVVPQTAGGFVLGAVYLRTRNPLGPILAHAFWDWPYFMLLGAGVSGGGTEGGVPSVASLLPWIAFMVYGLWLVRPQVAMVGRVQPVAAPCRACDAPVGGAWLAHAHR